MPRVESSPVRNVPQGPQPLAAPIHAPSGRTEPALFLIFVSFLSFSFSLVWVSGRSIGVCYLFELIFGNMF